MREIKFRAWDKVKHEMSYGGFQLWFDGQGSLKNTPPIDSYPCIELMQYTGFKDCKEREIYEDDIILYVNKKYRIVFDEGAWILQDSKSYEEDDYIMLWNMHQWAEVVGNAHEHPELLENKK